MDVDHYVKKLKEHEDNKTSTNDRNKYWKTYQATEEYKKRVPPSKARFEHG